MAFRPLLNAGMVVKGADEEGIGHGLLGGGGSCCIGSNLGGSGTGSPDLFALDRGGAPKRGSLSPAHH